MQNTLFNRIVVYQQNPLPKEVDIERTIQELENSIPRFFCDDIDSIFIGQFDFLKDTGRVAVYENGSIFVTNEQEDVLDLVNDLVHEIAHAVEETYAIDIYGDKTIEAEFLAKRKTMFEILQAHEIPGIKIEDFLRVEYDAEFDSFLYESVGYELLSNLTQGLFISPYGATSLREYFANSFEEFFTGESSFVKTISPSVYEKLIMLQGY